MRRGWSVLIAAIGFSSAGADEVPVIPPSVPSSVPTIEEAIPAPADANPEAREADSRTDSACADACRAARSERRDPASCPRRSRMPSEYFCPSTDRMYVNPFAVLRSNPGGDVCRHRLLYQAEGQAARVLDRRRSGLSSELRSVFEVARQGSSTACSSASSVSGEAGRMEASLTAVSVAEITREQEREYCRRVVPSGCEQLGGRMRSLPPPFVGEACVAGGLAIDSSCLSQSPSRLANLKSSIEALTNTGVRCLSGGRGGTPGLAPEAGQVLRDHLEAATPKTQVCCVTGGCANPVPGFRQSGNVVSENAAADSIGDAGGGTVRIPPGGLSRSDLRATLFHEMLHQIGMCDAGHEHNTFTQIRFVDWVVEKPAGGSCPAGYRERYLPEGSPARNLVITMFRQLRAPHFGERFPRSLSSLRTAARPPADITPADMERYARLVTSNGPVCLKANSCGGVLPPPPPFIEAYDNVYACEAACYEPGRMRRFSVAEAQIIRNSCGARGSPAMALLASGAPQTSMSRCMEFDAPRSAAPAAPAH
jgi:hypothetical protein